MKIAEKIVEMLPPIIEALVQLIPQLIISVVSICKEKKNAFSVFAARRLLLQNSAKVLHIPLIAEYKSSNAKQ